MDPLTGATSFAAIISLLADFTNHRRHRSDQDYDDFMSWLTENRHVELVSLLQQNFTTVVSVKALLSQDRGELRHRLDHMDRALATLASAIDGFSSIAAAVRPDAQLSEQALRILKEFDASGAGKALDVRTLSDRSLLLFEGGDGTIKFDDQRFIDDDLNLLVESGLLRLSHNSRGDRLYLFTRVAADYLRTLRS